MARIFGEFVVRKSVKVVTIFGQFWSNFGAFLFVPQWYDLTFFGIGVACCQAGPLFLGSKSYGAAWSNTAGPIIYFQIVRPENFSALCDALVLNVFETILLC